jgi:UDP-glucose 4-epimerase
MRILVTGGAGFIGSGIHSCCVNKDHEVVVLDNFSTGTPRNFLTTANVRRIDITDRPSVAEFFANERFDIICHQAAQISVSKSTQYPYRDAEVNCMGWLNILDHAANAGVRRIIFASSGGTLYGDVTAPVRESAPIRPVSPYGINKWTGEQYLEFYARKYKFEAVALRYANVYGPRQNPHGEAGVVAIFCNKLFNEQPMTIFGDGAAIRDYIYVNDVVDANYAAMITDNITPGEMLTLNVGTGVGTTTAAIAHLIQQEVRQQWPHITCKPIEHAPAREGDLKCSLLDPFQAYVTLDWRPTVKLAQGLQNTVLWFGPADI